MTPWTVVVADDSGLYRTHLRRVLARDRRFSLVEVACDGAAALDAVTRLRPDAALLDWEMPHLTGPQVAAAAAQASPATAVLIITARDEDGEPTPWPTLRKGATAAAIRDALAARIEAHVPEPAPDATPRGRPGP